MASRGLQMRIEEDTATAALSSIVRTATDPTQIMSAIAAFMVSAVQDHFQTETGPDGKWKRLSPRTAAQRIGRRRRGTENILRVSNRLYSSITGDSGPAFAAVGTNVEYAAAQHAGATINIAARQQDIHLSTGKGRRRFVRASAKRKDTRNVTIGAHTITIPARPFVYLNDVELAETLEIAADALRAEADTR